MRKPAGKLISFVWIAALVLLNIPALLESGVFVKQDSGNLGLVALSQAEFGPSKNALSSAGLYPLAVENSSSDGIINWASEVIPTLRDLAVVVLNFSKVRLVVVADPQPQMKVFVPFEQVFARFGSLIPVRLARTLDFPDTYAPPATLKVPRQVGLKEDGIREGEIFFIASSNDLLKSPKVAVLLC